MKTELLIQLDGLAKKEDDRIFILAASNLPWELDSALLRRLEKRVLIPLPTDEARALMIEKFIPANCRNDINLNEIAKELEGYSGSDIYLVCKEAKMSGLRRKVKEIEKEKTKIAGNTKKSISTLTAISDKRDGIFPVTNEDLFVAIKNTKSSSKYNISSYEKWMNQFGSE